MDHHAIVTPVRLRITLPTIDQLDAIGSFESAHQKSACRSSKTAQRAVERTAETPSRGSKADSRQSRYQTQPSRLIRDCVPTISPEMDSTPISIVSPPMTASVMVSRGECRTSAIGFVPATLPSQFMKAKPRLYRATTRPSTTCTEMHYTVVNGGTDENFPQSYEIGGNGESTIPYPESKRATNPARGDHLSVVAITDSGAHLRLDFQASNNEAEARKASKHSGLGMVAPKENHPTTISWSALTAEQQATELMAACRSRFVTEYAISKGFVFPTASDFSGSDVKAQLRVRQFKRWYLTSPDTRPGFLNEELRYAAGSNLVLSELSRVSATLPPRGDFSSSAWANFTTWYSTGIPVGDDDMTKVTMTTLSDRIVERTRFLQSRIQALDDFEEEKKRSLENEESVTYFIFDTLPNVHITTAEGSPTLWASQPSCNQLLELQLVLQSATIQSAAFADEVTLPDLAICLTQSCDLALLAKDFIAWWGAPDNFHRHGFLEEEVKAAASDTAVKKAMEEDAETVDNAADGFVDRYFVSQSARKIHLENKLRNMRALRRIYDVARSGIMPSPLVCELEMPPSAIVFSFPNVIVDEVEHACGVAAIEDSQPTVREDIEDIATDTTEIEVDGELGLESKMREEELALMATEDALSSYLTSGYESASDDEQEDTGAPIDPPKRTDFTHSYFFGNLPKAFRINSGGWIAGSGVDNGDEEIEEEERLERERKHQEMLDRLEAERIAEAERQAELQRIEKEKEEKALQLRRLRLLELKKILAYQAELEMKRARDIEFQNMMRERANMMSAEREGRLWITRLEEERSAMVAEDERAKLLRLAEYQVRKDAMRQMLAELTAMDAEDRRSAAFQQQQLDLERRQKQRSDFLKELYEPFEPYYPSSKVASEDFLPTIRRHRRHRGERPKAAYTLPYVETMTIDEVESEPYVARDSRKLRVLMGLSTTNPLSRRMMRIPSAEEIIGGRQALQLMLPSTRWTEEDRYESASENDWQSHKPTTNQVDHPPQRLLPSIVPWTAESDEKLTDLTCIESSDYSKRKRPNRRTRRCKPKPAESSHRESTALPFFRGNFVVRGEGKSRSQDYAPH